LVGIRGFSVCLRPFFGHENKDKESRNEKIKQLPDKKHRKVLSFHHNLLQMQKYLLLFFLTIYSALHTKAHEDTTLSPVKTSVIENNYFLPANIHIYIDTFNHASIDDIKTSDFIHLEQLPGKKVPKKYLIDGYVYILFKLENNEQTNRSFYFTPGVFAKELTLYKRNGNSGSWQVIARELQKTNQRAYHHFSTDPGSSLQLLAKVKFAKTNIILLKPYLINENMFDYHINFIHTHWFGLDIVTYIISGILLMMLLFSLVNYFQNRKREFLYYSIYALCMAVLLSLKAILYKSSTGFNFFNEEYLDYALQIIGYIFYVGFTRMFLNTPSHYPVLNKLFIASEVILAASLAAFTFCYFTNEPYPVLSRIENFSKLFMIFLGIAYLILGILQRNKLMNYLLAGNVANLLMGGISQYMILVPNSKLFPDSGLFRQSLFYFELGLLLELILFLAGLVYKNKIELIEKVKMDEELKVQKQRQEYEQEIAVLKAQQDERTRISADMHDELGSGVTAIRLLSEIALQKTKEQPVEEISRISFNANELMAKMNGIIWSMNPGNDTLDGLLSYIRSYTSEYLDNFNLTYKINIPEPIPVMDVTGVKRRNLFLVIKESLNNIMKHSRATEVKIDVLISNLLTIEITDNGKGIDPTMLNQYGNGLRNMQRRIESIGGHFSIFSKNGTTVVIQVPIAG
jgi:signal transduction histidine kinase